MNAMNIPGFTAEATLYNSATSYRSSFLFQTDMGNVTPQLRPENPAGFCYCNGETCVCGSDIIIVPFGAGGTGEDAADKRIEVACRKHCITRFRGALQNACLQDC